MKIYIDGNCISTRNNLFIMLDLQVLNSAEMRMDWWTCYTFNKGFLDTGLLYPQHYVNMNLLIHLK